MHPWLARLRHDLLKPVLWCVRDLRDLGRLDGPLAAADLQALRRSLLELRDGEGQRVTALSLWQELRADSPAPPAAVAAFEAALAAAEAEVAAVGSARPSGGGAGVLAAVLHLESAFLLLAQEIKR